MAEDNVYVRNGYENRDDYLDSLADNFGMNEYIVHEMADILGENEDFDGLINELEDFDYDSWE